MPLSASCSPIQAELLSTMMPSKSSVPMAMTSHRIPGPRLFVGPGRRAWLLDGRKRRGEQDFGVLPHDGAVAGRWPNPLGRGPAAHFEALIEAAIGPDMHPLIEPADVGAEDADQRGELDTAGQELAPALGHDGKAGRL